MLVRGSWSFINSDLKLLDLKGWTLVRYTNANTEVSFCPLNFIRICGFKEKILRLFRPSFGI